MLAARVAARPPRCARAADPLGTAQRHARGRIGPTTSSCAWRRRKRRSRGARRLPRSPARPSSSTTLLKPKTTTTATPPVCTSRAWETRKAATSTCSRGQATSSFMSASARSRFTSATPSLLRGCSGCARPPLVGGSRGRSSRRRLLLRTRRSTRRRSAPRPLLHRALQACSTGASLTGRGGYGGTTFGTCTSTQRITTTRAACTVSG
mmetsp:Transcript_58984/g.144664  ORF Transcript_58984/g.144664 Transcript_58984/m.144664 type:complete len:208 (+) Transcript_58984:227-850(+)